MKVALIILKADRKLGGAERYTLDLAAALAARGHDVSVLASSHEAPSTAEQFRRVYVSASGLTRTGQYRRFLREVDALLTRERFDIAHGMLPVLRCDVYHPHAGIMAAAHADKGVIGRLNFRRTYMARVERQMLTQSLPPLNRPPLTLCLSNYVASQFTPHYPEAQWERLFNGVDTQRFDPSRDPAAGPAFRASLGLAPTEKVALFVGQDFARKGLDTLIAALSPSAGRPAEAWKVIVAGDESRNRGYRAKVTNAGLAGRFHFVGNLPDAYPAYAASDLLALPTHHDPCSLVVLEAASMGLPILTTTRNGAGEFLEQGVTGEVLDPGDVDRWASVLDEWVVSKRLRGAKERMLSMRERVDSCHHITKLLEIYEKHKQSRGLC